MRTLRWTCILGFTLAACSDDSTPIDTPDAGTQPVPVACDAEPEILTTGDGVRFVRTPDACFEDLPGWPYAPEYVEIDGLRQAYVDEGPADGPVVLLLHGQPSWSYLYRKMIPVLVDGGYRVIAMDHVGMGRSDKPIDIRSYSYLGHSDRLERFIEALDLRDINLFVQDWGSLIGLRVAGLNPDRFARIAVGDGALPVVPAGVQPYPPVENPDEVVDLEFAFGAIPDQQTPFFDGCEPRFQGGTDFGAWMIYAMKARSFTASEVIEALTWFDLPADEEAAYDAPFPSRTYMAGPRVFPSLVNDLPGLNEDAWAGLTSFTKPFLTLWASNDPGNLGQCETQRQLAQSVPGAWGQPHDRLPESSHFLQDDQGAEIGRRLVEFYASGPVDPPHPFGRHSRYCEVLLVEMTDDGLEAEVWGTQSVNDCPAESWEALDASTIMAETGALAVNLNGPRVWLPSSTVGALASHERMTFGDLETRLLATVAVSGGQTTGPYNEITVNRTTTYTFEAGVEIYELTSPDGVTYVMQSMSQIVDPDLQLTELSTAADRLMLPQGWRYAPRTLDQDFVLEVEGQATVITDDLLNTYQRVTTSTTPTGLPILDDGTGTPCSSDADCQALDASHCLMGAAGGFCTVEGCAGGGCGMPYVCCYDCSPAAEPFLPFEGSACVPDALSQPLSAMAGCTCQ